MNNKVDIVDSEVKTAYSDCHEFKAGPRNLDFRASESVSVEDAVAIMEKYVPGYNDFRPELLWQLPKDVEVVIAREGSVCLYLSLPEGFDNMDTFDCIRTNLKCDECSVEECGEIRVWWD